MGCHVGALDRKSCKNKWRERRRRRSRAQNEKPQSRRRVNDAKKLTSSMTSNYTFTFRCCRHSEATVLTQSHQEGVFYIGCTARQDTLNQNFKFIIYSSSHIFLCELCPSPSKRHFFFYIIKKTTGKQRVQSSSSCRS